MIQTDLLHEHLENAISKLHLLITFTQEDIEDIKQAKHDSIFSRNNDKVCIIKEFEIAKNMIDKEILLTQLINRIKASGNQYWISKIEVLPSSHIHVAVMVEPYITKIMKGEKTIESRFSQNKIVANGFVSCLFELTDEWFLACCLDLTISHCSWEIIGSCNPSYNS